ncbi:MAG: hypothetical protein II131_03750, partial [Neisseriaceae bacterium]|nr:hypothetical protein [Neisseriaceae bacterium]
GCVRLRNNADWRCFYVFRQPENLFIIKKPYKMLKSFLFKSFRLPENLKLWTKFSFLTLARR